MRRGWKVQNRPNRQLLYHVIRADQITGAGAAVFQKHGLSQDFRQCGRQKPRGDIRPAPGAEGNHNADGPGWPGRLGIAGAAGTGPAGRDEATAGCPG